MAKQQVVKSNGGLNVNMLYAEDTKGALIYQEVNDVGEAIDASMGAKIGRLYLRKSAFPSGTWPKAISVSITVRA